VAEAHLSKIIKVDLKSDLFTYGIDAKVLESEIEIAPVLHRQPERIRAHASICFMALILYRVMRQRLKAAAGHAASPETALAQLRRIQRQRVSINQRVPIIGNSTITREQAGRLAVLNVKSPNLNPN
jgi:hypothetical protein